MNVKTFEATVSRLTLRMTSLLLDVVGQHDAAQARFGLPAGAVHLQERQLILAGTPCDPPFFHVAMRNAAAATGADVVVIHHGLHPEALNPVRFSVLVHMSGKPYLFEERILYFHPMDGYWLVPIGKGPFVALEEDGLRVDFEPPFVTFNERCDGVCQAAAEIVRTTRSVGVM